MTSGFESEFPGNSHKSKVVEPEAEPKKVEQVTQGKVVRRKIPISKRLVTLFIAGDPDVVMRHVLMDVLLPQARDLAANMVTEYVEQMIFGGSRSSSNRRPGARLNNFGAPGYVSYNRYAQKPTSEAPRAGGLSVRDKSMHNFDQIILETRAEAEAVIDQLFELVSQYEQATVADLYTMCNESSSFTDAKWGWTDIRGADVQRVNGGYLLRLPAPKAFD